MKVTLNKKTVFSLLKKKLNEEELEEKTSLLGIPIEEINENEIIVEVTPNRPDLLSEQGYTRALNMFLGYNVGLRKYNVYNSKEKVIIEDSLKGIRPYTACAIVKDLDLDEEKINEIINLQEKLHLTFGRNRKKVAIGVYPFEKIKTPIRFLALNKKEIKFIPLGENKSMTGEEILNKHDKGKEFSHLLNNFDKYPLFIDANNNVLSMPPIINSQNVGEVTLKTKDVFIECSGHDFNILNKCLNIIVTSLGEMGGKIYSMELKYKDKTLITPNLKPEEIDIKIENVNKLLGIKLNENEIKLCLEKLGYDYNNKKVQIPCYRADIMHEVDIIEDIAIGYGYDKFTPELPNLATVAEEDKFEIFKDKIRDILTGFSLMETYSYVIGNKDDQNNRMLLNNDLVLLKNSLNQEYDVLRLSILPNLLKILSKNKHNEYPQNIFEIGNIFKKGESETNVKENYNLAVMLCHSKADFTQIKQILSSLLSSLNLKYEIEELENESFISGRCGSIKINNKEIAYIGEINPQVLSNFNLDIPASCFELNLNELFNLLVKTEHLNIT